MAMFPSKKEAVTHVSQIAQNTNKVVSCGKLACQHDSFQKILDTAAIASHATYSSTEDGKSNTKKKKKKKGGANDDTTTNNGEKMPKFGDTVFAIAMTDSIFFPEGGGQPPDHGSLTLRRNGDDYNDGENGVKLYVQDAQNVGEICVLTCRVPHTVPNEHIEDMLVQANAQNLQIIQEIDFKRRFELMTQHSAQHLLSAVALSNFNIGTHTFSLLENRLISYIDFIIKEDWDTKDHVMGLFHQIEQIANSYIRQNLKMTPQWLDPNDAAFETKVRSRLLPSGIVGPIRLVEIDNDIDFNTCCGTHVPSLGHLQMIKLFRTERVKPTIFRVHFAAANRLMTVMDGMYGRQASLNSMMSCKDDEQVKRVTQLLEDKREREKEIQELKAKLCHSQSKEIMEECKINNNVAVVDLGAADMGYMTMLSTSVLEKVDDAEKTLLLFVSGEISSDEGSFLLVGKKDIVDKVGKQIAGLLEGRGGGRNGKFQGKGMKIRSALPDVKRLLVGLEQA